ncbi:MAG: hypothetical protein HOA15_09470 [Candidatus Marinimicrobia bacterium]|nr:hypothetical protein [Candidatus Neomarinimicrobiota bacterium]MBT3676420.1 hypothetical protein [Candidatus Neomarinimicrobiota bacterium]MBT3763766.1 hypothetical protein [Candidatus Neomarinimicrobiota bacterium]MBT4270051.1 hypothetical protein [Candidatus Neomarinimicrobiota bacterium]MBT4808613.1 hypothetical protein [Candidatus Neomarinimicrobiota bacterium]
MIRILIYGTLAYIVYALFKQVKLVSKATKKSVKQKGSYKNFDIKDADYEDLNNEGNNEQSN